MTRRSKSEPPKILCSVNCCDFGCFCSPLAILEANQKMLAERFAEINHSKRRNVRKREQRRRNKIESQSDQEQQKRPSEPDFDFGGPI